mgnify:FL=1
MMIWLKYLGLSGIGIALFYLLGVALLRKSTLLRAKRWYYLIAIASCLLLPLLSIAAPERDMDEAQDRLLPSFTIVIEEEPTITAPATKRNSIDWSRVLMATWAIGAASTLIWLTSGGYKLYRLCRTSTKRELSNNATLYEVDEELAPFTIGRAIFIPKSLSNSDITPTILSHELEHIRQKHYWDIIISTVLQPLQWWNPCAWGLLQQLRTNLEYLADQGVLREGRDRKTYQYQLLECTLGRKVELPSLSFSMQNLKKRIVMMNSKNKTNKKLAIVYALSALPVLAFLALGTQMVTIKQAKASTITEVAPPPTKDKVFEKLDEMPEFPGGGKAMMQWLSHNIQYPKDAIDAKIEGRVVVSFIVEKDGSISNAEVKKGVYESLDKEALRIVNAMPKWKPGMQAGQPARTRFFVPINFKFAQPAVQGEKVFDYLDDMPEFPGGQAAMMQWLSQNIQYPKEAVDGNIKGRVIVSFIIEKDGSISNAKVTKGVHESLDKEALRVVSAMPNWKPGMQDGQPARCQFTLPVSFKFAQPAVQEEKVFEYLDDMPEFPGGGKAMMEWLGQNIQYPKEAVDAKVEGRVMVSFVIEKDGSVSNAKVIRSIDPLLDNEALRVVNAMPNWKPGMQDGQPARVRFTIPVSFKLPKPATAPTK